MKKAASRLIVSSTRDAALMNRGDNVKAIDKLNDAIGVERNNREFWVTLAEAQYAAGKYTDADNTPVANPEYRFNRRLGKSHPGPRAAQGRARVSHAVSYFHRAIYGHWQPDAEGNRRRARLELIDLLDQQNSKEELLAELLPMEDQTPNDLNMRAHLGELFLRAGSPARAAQVYRGILNESPNNAAAYAGIGQAEFADGNYRAAQRDLQAALRIAPNDTANRHWLDLCDKLLQLDPTLRGLSVRERLHRSTNWWNWRKRASPNASREPSPEMQDLMAKADGALKRGEALCSKATRLTRIWI